MVYWLAEVVISHWDVTTMAQRTYYIFFTIIFIHWIGLHDFKIINKHYIYIFWVVGTSVLTMSGIVTSTYYNDFFWLKSKNKNHNRINDASIINWRFNPWDHLLRFLYNHIYKKFRYLLIKRSIEERSIDYRIKFSVSMIVLWPRLFWKWKSC